MPALKCLAEIIERGIRQHPELNVGMTTEGIDVRSVGNTKALHDTALIEAFNLKAAIEYNLKNRLIRGCARSIVRCGRCGSTGSADGHAAAPGGGARPRHAAQPGVTCDGWIDWRVTRRRR